jgi:hypothetical protein
MLALTDSALAPLCHFRHGPRPAAATRSNCSPRLVTARPRRSCSRTASQSSRWLICASLAATATPERMVVGGHTVEVARVWITEAGRKTELNLELVGRRGRYE